MQFEIQDANTGAALGYSGWFQIPSYHQAVAYLNDGQPFRLCARFGNTDEHWHNWQGELYL